MIEFGDLFDANLNPVKSPVYEPLKKEFASQEFKELLKSSPEGEHLNQYLSALPDSLELKKELVSFFENEGIIKKFVPRKSMRINRNPKAKRLRPLSPPIPPSYINLLKFPESPLYTPVNYIEELCFLHNPDCPVFFQQSDALKEDIINALIFNLRYMERRSLDIKYDPVQIKNLYFLYEDGKGKSRKAICDSIIPKSNLGTDFCYYSMSVLFTYDATHPLPDKSLAKSRPFYSIFNTLTNESSKARTFRKMLDAISCSENLTPRLEDQWYLEKIFGFSTVAAIYPFVAKYSISKKESIEVANSLLHVLLKCQPLRTRIYLAKVVSGAASSFQQFFQRKDSTANQVYSENFEKYLLYPLEKTVDFINQVYFTTLNALYDAAQVNPVLSLDVLEYYDIDNLDLSLPCIANPNRFALSKKNIRGLKTLFYPQDIAQFIFEFSSTPDAIVKTISPSRNNTALFSSLQTTAIKEILTNYNIPY